MKWLDLEYISLMPHSKAFQLICQFCIKLYPESDFFFFCHFLYHLLHQGSCLACASYMALVLPTHPSLQSPCKNYNDSLTYKSVMASFQNSLEFSIIFRIKSEIHKILKKNIFRLNHDTSFVSLFLYQLFLLYFSLAQSRICILTNPSAYVSHP